MLTDKCEKNGRFGKYKHFVIIMAKIFGGSNLHWLPDLGEEIGKEDVYV